MRTKPDEFAIERCCICQAGPKGRSSHHKHRSYEDLERVLGSGTRNYLANMAKASA